MNTFRLTQVQAGKNIYLLPNANGCNIGLTRYPDMGESNYQDVDDPISNPDDDETYVHSNATDLLYDMYEVENHGIAVGNINYVQVFARAKSHQYTQSSDGIFKIGVSENDCTNTYWSDDINLLTMYNTYSYVWKFNPRTSVAWTWDKIDNIQIGVEFSSPTVNAAPYSVTLHDDGLDTYEFQASTGNYWYTVYNDNACCEDGTWMPFVRRVYCTFEDTTLGPEYTITNVRLVAKIDTDVGKTSFPCTESPPGQCRACSDQMPTGKLMLRTHAVEYFSSDFNFDSPGVWTTKTLSYALNPNTSAAWTWAEVDAIVGGCYAYYFNDGIFCGAAQILSKDIQVIVDYLGDVNPDIRTTQMYMKVNYDEEVLCNLNMPEEVSQDYVQNIKMLNHWSGNRSVYGLARSKDTTVMTGWAVDGTEATETFYFDTYDVGVNEWATNPVNMIDGNTGTNASTNVNGDRQGLMSSTASNTDYDNCIKKITKVEIRAYAWTSAGGSKVELIPIYIEGNGDEFDIRTTTPGWSQWFDVTSTDIAHFGSMPNSPAVWTWHDLRELDVNVNAILSGGGSAYCSKVEVRVTYHDDSCCHLQCIEAMAKQGDPVTLSGFSYSDYNDEYRILSFGWQKISALPVYYAWILELERTT